MKYKLKKDDIVYESDRLVVLVPELEAQGTTTTTIELIEVALNMMEAGECIFINGISDGDKKRVLGKFIKRLNNLTFVKND